MKLCLQTDDIIDRIGFERGYKLFKECGFEAVDWNIDHAWKNSDIRNGTYEGTCIFEKSIDEVMKYYSEELSYIKNNGLIISQAHAPFPAYVKGHPEVTDYAVKIYIKFA